jgi:hypothetical protein
MSRLGIIALAIALHPLALAWGQEAPGEKAESPSRFVVELTQIVIPEADAETVKSLLADAKQRDAALNKLEEAGKIKLHQSILLTALENAQAMAQFGNRVPIVTGSTIGPGGRTRNVHFENVGTLVRLTARLDGEKAMMEINFEDSRVEASNEPDLPASTNTLTVNSTVTMSLGEPVVVSSRATDDFTLVLAKITAEPTPERVIRKQAAAAKPRAETAPTQEADPSANPTAGIDPRYVKYAESLIAKHDRDGDGYLDELETKTSSGLGDFSSLDVNDDKRVDVKELIRKLQNGSRR